MADLTITQASQLVSITGSDSSGLETNPVNSDTNGNLLVKPASNGPVTPGTVATFSSLIGGQFNTVLPTLTSGQQSAIQVDSSGRLITTTTIAATPDTTATGALGALNAAVQVALVGQQGVGFQLSAGTLIGTIVPEISFDGGTTWVITTFDSATTSTKTSSIVFASANTAQSVSIIGSAGMSHARVRVSAYTSGTANITLRASQARDPSVLFATSAGASVLPPSIAYMGGSVTTAAPTYTTGTLNGLSLTTSGLLRVDASGSVQAVSQSGAWNITNITGTVSLPTGASTSALQTTGNTSLSTIVTNTTGLVVPQGSATAGQSGQLVLGAVTTAAPTYTTAQSSPLSLNTAGALRVDSSGTSQTANQGNAGTAAQGWFSKITDGTNVAAVKAASTAALATDPSLVVTISPNSNLSVNTANTTATGTMGALNAIAGPFNTDGQISIGAVITGTWVGNIQAQASVDGVNWVVARTSNKSTNDIVQNYTINDSFAFYDLGGIRQVRLVMTAYTSGTANVTFEGTQMNIQELLNYSGTDGDVAPPLRHLSMASLSTDGTLHAIRNSNTDPLGTEYALITRSIIYGIGSTSFSPDPTSTLTGIEAQPLVDNAGNLEIRGQVLTDEGSFRDDFTGANLATNLTGTTTFTNGSAIVTGVGTTFTTQLSTENYVKVAAQSDAFYTRVMSVDSDTQLTLEVVYPGATAAGATAAATNWSINAVGTGAVTVATSEVLLAPGTGATGAIGIRHTGDYPPYTLLMAARMTQRVANQTALIGFQDNPAAPGAQCGVLFTGTVNTTVTFRTAYSAQASEIQDTVVTLPGGATTAATNRYQIDLLPDAAVLSINGVVVATNNIHIPAPYVSLTVNANIINTAVVTATTLGIDYVFFSNQDVVQIDNVFSGTPVAMSASGVAANGAIISGNPVLVGGYDGTNVRTLLTSNTGVLRIDPSGTTTQPVSGTLAATQSGAWNITNITGTVSLPTGASTSALQTTGNTSLATIATNTPALGQATMAASSPVVIASNQSNLPTNVVQIGGVTALTGGVAGSQGVGGLAASGAAKAGNPVLIGGQDGTNAQTLLTDNTGRLITNPAITTASAPATYSAAITGLVASATAPTDIFTITGSASKTIRVTRIALTATQTTAAQRDILVLRRSTANTAGTSTAQTAVTHDSTNAAATATVLAYTVNPTLGTTVGTLRTRKVFIGATAANSDEFIMDFGTRSDQAVVLRGVTQVLAVNLNGVVSAGSSFDISIEWTEE